eukprot:134963-Pelagomonas_calceolata.AAC.2
MILKVVSKGSYGSNLVHMDVDRADRLAQHDLHITELVVQYLYPSSTPVFLIKLDTNPATLMLS